MASLQTPKIAVAGINGTLGPTIIQHLLAANFPVTVLTRDRSATLTTWPYTPFHAIIQVDYASPTSLVSALTGHDVLISLISRLDPTPHQTLHTAACTAGIPRIIPSCFGAKHRLSSVRDNPALLPKIAMEEHLEGLAAQGLTTYTGINQGALLDWAVQKGIFANAKGATMVLNGGDVPFSTTLLDDVGKAIVAALRKPEETRDRYLYIHSRVVTQNGLLGLFKEIRPDLEFARVELDSQVLADRSREAYERGERGADALRGFLVHMTFGQKLGVFETTDNELLGIEELSDERLREVVGGVMEEVLAKEDYKPKPM